MIAIIAAFEPVFATLPSIAITKININIFDNYIIKATDLLFDCPRIVFVLLTLTFNVRDVDANYYS